MNDFVVIIGNLETKDNKLKEFYSELRNLPERRPSLSPSLTTDCVQITGYSADHWDK